MKSSANQRPSMLRAESPKERNKERDKEREKCVLKFITSFLLKEEDNEHVRYRIKFNSFKKRSLIQNS